MKLQSQYSRFQYVLKRLPQSTLVDRTLDTWYLSQDHGINEITRSKFSITFVTPNKMAFQKNFSGSERHQQSNRPWKRNVQIANCYVFKTVGCNIENQG